MLNQNPPKGGAPPFFKEVIPLPFEVEQVQPSKTNVNPFGGLEGLSLSGGKCGFST